MVVRSSDYRNWPLAAFMSVPVAAVEGALGYLLFHGIGGDAPPNRRLQEKGAEGLGLRLLRKKPPVN